MKKPVQVYVSSVLKACRPRHVSASIAGAGNNNMSSSSFSSPPPPTTSTSGRRRLLVGPPQLARMAASEIANISPSSSYANPCLDLFFHIRPPNPPNEFVDEHYMPKATPYSHRYLKHLLPLAWSHNPLTTLKLVYNLLDCEDTGKNDREGFDTAAYWLYQNHPNTLACNVAPIAGSFGNLTDLLELLCQILEGEGVRKTRTHNDSDSSLELEISSEGIEGRASSRRRREKILAMAKKALERYRRDPSYRLLHDSVSDLYAHSLKSDIQNLNNYRRHYMIRDNDGGHESSKCLEITSAAKWCPYVDSTYDRATLLCESIAKKVFPRESSEETEVDYAHRVRQRLRKEVLVPLRKALELRPNDHESANQWGYAPVFKSEPCAAKRYLEEVMKALARGGGGKSDKIIKEAGALLPNEIVGYVKDADVGQAAELQWKTMVEDIYLKQGKLKNCMAVFQVEEEVFEGMRASPSWDAAVALTVLASQLSDEPWKGKIICFTFLAKPELHSIQGHHDLKSKCEFVNSLDLRVKDSWDDGPKLHQVFDLILEVAVKENLKPEQMIKKVFVLTPHQDFYSMTEFNFGKSDYGKIHSNSKEKIHRKFKEKGYGHVVPQVVFWNLNNGTAYPPRTTEQGEVMLGGFSNNLFKSFLDNDGGIGPDHVMEAAISGEKYQSLEVVD